MSLLVSECISQGPLNITVILLKLDLNYIYWKYTCTVRENSGLLIEIDTKKGTNTHPIKSSLLPKH